MLNVNCWLVSMIGGIELEFENRIPLPAPASMTLGCGSGCGSGFRWFTISFCLAIRCQKIGESWNPGRVIIWWRAWVMRSSIRLDFSLISIRETALIKNLLVIA
jgi:hypothetical protein